MDNTATDKKANDIISAILNTFSYSLKREVSKK